jgi:hypothetical protein
MSLPNLAAEYAIHYKLTVEHRQVRLRLWEMHPRPQHNPQPYLYAANYSFSHRAEAEAFLRDYLYVNGAFDVPDRRLPAEGEIAILPFPTWSEEMQ